jgi:hypothetical protein
MALSLRPFGDVLADRDQHHLMCPIQALNLARCSSAKQRANTEVDPQPIALKP